MANGPGPRRPLSRTPVLAGRQCGGAGRGPGTAANPGIFPPGTCSLLGYTGRMTRSGARLAALVRILTGLIFVVLGTSKVFGEFVHGGFALAVKGMIKDSWPVWRGFLQSVVLPIAHVFAWIVALGELALGIGLLLGFWTQVVAGGGSVP